MAPDYSIRAMTTDATFKTATTPIRVGMIRRRSRVGGLSERTGAMPYLKMHPGAIVPSIRSSNHDAPWTRKLLPEVRIHTPQPSPSKGSVMGGALVELQELALDGPHPCHQTVELRQKACFLLPGRFHGLQRRAVANALQGIGQLPVQEPHALLQFQEFLL